jgi:predicted nucleic acid-binding protein
MSDVVFVDTNILVYAHDADAGAKRDRAIERLRELWEADTGRLSVQVLQEFYVDVTRKLTTRVARSTAREVVNTMAHGFAADYGGDCFARDGHCRVRAALFLGCIDRCCS